MTKYEVFISYRRNGGQELAKYLKDEFEKNAIFSFFDDEELHFGDFRRQIIKNNINSENLVLLLSTNKEPENENLVQNALGRCENKGDWVKREIICALLLHKRIIPIVYKGFRFDELIPKGRLYKIIMNKARKDGIFFDGEDMGSVAEKVIEKLRKGWTDEERRRSISEINRYKTALEPDDDIAFDGFKLGDIGYDEAYETFVDKHRDKICKNSLGKMIFLFLGFLVIMSTLSCFFADGGMALDERLVTGMALGVPFGVFYYLNEGIVNGNKKRNSFSLLFEGEPVKGIVALVKNLLISAGALIVSFAPISIFTEIFSSRISGNICIGYCLVLFSLVVLIPFAGVLAYGALSIYDIFAVYGSTYFHKIFLRTYRRTHIEEKIARVTLYLGGIVAVVMLVLVLILTIGGVHLA